jgi:hypothetical protein
MTEIERMEEARDFPNNTCPASRHVQLIAEAMIKAEKYSMLDDDPEHCAVSLASVVSSLYQTRSFLLGLGYNWRVDENHNVEWYREDEFYEGRARRDNMTNPGDLDYDT